MDVMQNHQNLDPNRQALKMVTLNLGSNVMANKVQGSEGAFVQKCQETYPTSGGWTMPYSKEYVAQCTYNAIQFLSDYDLICLQEVNMQHLATFSKLIFDLGKQKGRNYEISISTYMEGTLALAILYNKNVLGQGLAVSPPNFTWTNLSNTQYPRGMQAVYFSSLKLIVINLHAPHDIPLKESVESAVYRIMASIKQVKPTAKFDKKNVSRVLLAGDFNDDRGNLLKGPVSITAFENEVRIPNQLAPEQSTTSYLNGSPKSCCYDSNYLFAGDYIMDSSVIAPGVTMFSENGMETKPYYGFPPGYNRSLHLYSDHDPVILVTPLHPE